MKRRTFLKNAAAAALTVGLPVGLGVKTAKAAAYDGPCFLFVHAQGGWDPRFLFDPTLELTQNRLYTEMREVGGIPVAGIPLDLARVGLAADQGYETYLRSGEQFLTAHADRLLVLNGLDTATVNHDTGERTMVTGRLSEGFPVLAGLIAAEYGGAMPMAFLSAGGMDSTEGVAPVSRIDDLSYLRRFGRPNDVAPDQAESEHYHSSDTMSRILKAQRARIASLQKGQRLPRLHGAMEALRAARETNGELDSLLTQDAPLALPAGLGDQQQMLRQAQLALNAFSAGVSVCARVNLGGFDTHGDHDRAQSLQLWKLLGGVDYISTYAADKGLQDRLVIVVTSDFARGPQYNADGAAGGKDHWPVTSALLMGPGIRGGRVIGATDDMQLARKLNPSRLRVSDNGVTLTSGHMHQSLRQLAGIANTSLAASYPIAETPLPLFE